MLAFAFLILFTSSSASVSALQLNSFPKVTTIQMSQHTKSTAIGTNKKYNKKTLLAVNSADETTAYGSKVHKLNEQIAKMVNDGIKVGMRLAAFQRKSKSIEHSKSDEFNEGKSDEMANYDKGIEGEEYGSEQSEEYGKSGERRWSSGGEASRAKATEAGRLVDILSPRFMSLTATASQGERCPICKNS
ncbi:hypothetical protein niasHT_024939 [Heterodera trifolii]|uniref:Uncharacterized protein n=1 Tax=Heterodera trifolii TaxID=157864 RepID=A0ABD2JA99_9BILA